MSKRLIIFGNSHVAAIKDALDQAPGGWPDLDVTIVGAHGEALMNTRLDGSVLIPTTDRTRKYFRDFGGAESFDLNRFDLIAIAGCQVAPARTSVIYKDARYLGLPSLAEAADLATMSEILMSRASFAAILRAEMQKSLGLRLAIHLRPATRTPIYLLSQARASAEVLTSSQATLRRLRHIVEANDGWALSDLFDETLSDLAAQSGIQFVPQPRDTIQDGILTPTDYMNGAIRLTTAGRKDQPAEDLVHANGAYGAKLLDQLDKLSHME
jgi:hypothetical protein